MTRIDRPDRGTPPRPVRGEGGDKRTSPSGRASQKGSSGAVLGGGGGGGGQPPTAALDRVHQVMIDKPGDDRAMLRAIMEPTMASALGRDAAVDPAFFALVDAVIDTLLASPEAMRLLEQARAEMARAAR